MGEGSTVQLLPHSVYRSFCRRPPGPAHLLRLVPEGWLSHEVRGAGREVELEGEAKDAVDVLQEVQTAVNLLGNLGRKEENTILINTCSFAFFYLLVFGAFHKFALINYLCILRSLGLGLVLGLELQIGLAPRNF